VSNGAAGATSAAVRLEVPRGWKAEPAEVPLAFAFEGEEIGARFSVTPPARPDAGNYQVRAIATAGGREYREGYQVIAYDHIQERHLFHPAAARLEAFDVRVSPGVSVGYVMGSGDEIVDLDRADDILSGKKVATSNSYTLHALIKQNGGIPVDLGLARDTKESLRDHLAAARQGSDLLVTTAGVSVGEHDFVREVLTELGGEIKLWRIAMRPGAPVGFGLLGGTPWIGLPGNPVSAMVTFELFVRPAIRRMLGHRLPFRRTVPVCVGEPIKLGPKLRHFLRAVVQPEGSGGALTARLTGPQGSGILTSMARANALLIVPEDRPTVAAGETLPALLLDDPHHVAEAPF